MTTDRAEWTGVGAALAFHLALIAALSMSLAHVTRQPEPQSMEVELVDDVALRAAAPTPAAAPPPSAAPEPSQPLPLQPPLPQAVAPPTPAPAQRPVPRQVQRPQLSRPVATPSRPVPRTSQLGDDFLKSLDSPQSAKASAPSAQRFDARAKASVAALFQRRVQPCANQQINPGEGANRIRVTVNLRLRPNGTLAGTPQIVRVSGVDDENGRFEERVKDLAVAVYRECSPFSGLPSELYKTPEGGWSNINLTYKLP